MTVALNEKIAAFRERIQRDRIGDLVERGFMHEFDALTGGYSPTYNRKCAGYATACALMIIALESAPC